jgi:hypothetical protein
VASHSSTARFPGFSALYFDNDRQHSEWVTVKEGINNINMQPSEPLERWGDYSGNQRKYDEPGVIWCASSYGRSNTDNDTWIGSLASPDYISSAKEEPVPAASLEVFPVPAADRVNLEFEAFGVRQIRISVMDMNGRLVRTFLEDKPKREGKARFSFATDPLANGMYILMVQGDGRTLASKKFVVSR